MARAADVCVIGSGPAGAAVACALTERGQSVIVLERGAYTAPADDVLGKGLASWDGRAEVGGTVRPILPALVGGGGEINGAVTHRFQPDDFALATRYRTVPGGAIVDWPFDYAELEPYYARAEILHGVSGTADGARHPPPRSTEFPHPPLVMDCAATRLLEDACRRADLHVQPTPVAILSRDTAERIACARCGMCAGYPCLYGSKGRPTLTTLRAAAATGRCTIVPRVSAHRLIVEEDAAVAVEYSDARGRRGRVEAERFVVAAGAIYTPLLLALSRSARFPTGLGNHADLLGRYLCAHPCPRTVGVFAEPIAPVNTHFAVRSIDDLYFLPEPLWKGGLLELLLSGAIDRNPPVTYPRAGPYTLPDAIASRATIYYCSDAVPQPTNRVVPSSFLDQHAMPLPRIELAFHPLDMASARHGVQTAARLLREMGAREVHEDTRWPAELGGGFHYSGTARAGTAPAHSVVDRDGRVHDCRNVYVADASMFPTSGGANPMLTVIANALRVADRMPA